MAIPQKKLREILFQVLYSLDINSDVDIMALGDHLKMTRRTMREASARLDLVLAELLDIDAKIDGAAFGYDFDRISRVERTILRIGTYELFYDDDIPPKVALSEAIRLCRKFSTPEGGSFVNGVLGALYQGEVKVS